MESSHIEVSGSIIKRVIKMNRLIVKLSFSDILNVIGYLDTFESLLTDSNLLRKFETIYKKMTPSSQITLVVDNN